MEQDPRQQILPFSEQFARMVKKFLVFGVLDS
jgi:hypothetical protein